MTIAGADDHSMKDVHILEFRVGRGHLFLLVEFTPLPPPPTGIVKFL